MKTLQKQIVIRVPGELHEALLVDAEANSRTLAQSVRSHLRRALTEDPRQ